jgi:hypothetical protein
VYYKIKSVFSDWAAVAILNSRDDVDKSIPCIVVEFQYIDAKNLELGDTTLSDTDSFYIIPVYASRSGELVDILDKLYNGLATTFNFIDYTNAFPDQTGYNEATQKKGTLDAYDITATKIYVGIDSESIVDRYRGQVEFRVKRNKMA